MANTHSLDLESTSSQYASITDASQTGLDITGDLTIEAWVKPESAKSNNTVISKYVTTGNQRAYIFDLTTNNVAASCSMLLYISPAGTSVVAVLSVTPSVAIPTGSWTHVAVTLDVSATQAEFFINGSSQGTDTDASASAVFNSSADFQVGAWTGSSWYFDGLMDDVRIWSDIRTSTEITNNYQKELAGTEANLEGYWKFNNNYTDATSNSNDLTATNSPVFSTDVAFVESTFIPKIMMS